MQKVTHLNRTDLRNLRKNQEDDAKKLRNLHFKESIQRVFRTFRQGPEIFNLLVVYLKTNKMKLNIPDSLVYLPSLPYPAYLFNGDDGFLQMDLSKNSVDNFFGKEFGVDCQQPQFIHITMSQRIKLCYSKSEARSTFEDCPHFSHRIHRWIPFTYHYASKLRVHWKKLKPPCAYILQNKIPIFQKSNQSSKPFFPIINPPKEHKKPVLEHKNALDAIKLKNLRETSNSNDNYPSKNNQSSIENQPIEMKKLLVQFSGTLNLSITQTTRYMQELQETFNSIVKLMNSVYFKNPNKLQELLLDFLKFGDKWILVACKGHKVKGDQDIKSLKKIELERSFNNSMMRGPSAMAFESVTEESLKSDESFDSLEEENEEIERTAKRIEFMAVEMNKKHGKIGDLNTQNYLEHRQSDSLGHLPYIMIGLLPHKIENPMTYFIEKEKIPPNLPNKPKSKEKPPYWVGNETISSDTYGKLTSKCLNNIIKVYNKHKQEAYIGRKNLHNKKVLIEVFQESGKLLQDSLTSVISQKKQSYSHYFEHKTEQDLPFISKNLLDCLFAINEYSVKKKVRNIHSNLNITGSEFDNFLKEFEIKLRDHLKKDQVQALIEKFVSFKNDVISE